MNDKRQKLEEDGYSFLVGENGFSFSQNNVPIYEVNKWPHLPEDEIERSRILWEAALNCASEYQRMIAPVSRRENEPDQECGFNSI